MGNLLCLATAFAQPREAIQRMGAAETQQFDDSWLFARYGLQPDGTRKDEPANLQNTEVDDKQWKKLSLPHDWAIEGPFRIELTGETGKLPWKGIGWYRKHFKVAASNKGKKIFIDFDGAMANAQVWLNGQYLGTWPFGYNSFRFELTPRLKFGEENILAVRLDTENWDSRWYPGAGIYRHVWLIKTSDVHVAHWGTYITTPEVSADKALVNIAVTVSNQSSGNRAITLLTTLHELDGDNKVGKKVAEVPVLQIDQMPGEQTHSIKVNIDNPKRWDIESPNRYVAITIIASAKKTLDTYYTPFGIRTIEFTAHKGFLLNGRRVEINGTCNHHDLGALGAAINTSALRRQLSMLKQMGVNSLRTSHNPPAPELLELADKMGFLVWDEAFDAWKKGKKKNDYNKLYDEWHEKDLIALVRRDRNHPSVFIWSIGNEVPDQRNVEITKHLAGIMRKEDPTRPVSNGYNDPDGGREVGAVVALDIMGVNYFFSQQPRWDADPRYQNKPTIGSETSSCVSTRGEYFFGTDYKNWQISSYDNAFPGWGCSPDTQFKTNAAYPHLLGEYVWTGFDYLGEPTPYNSDETNLLNFRTDPTKQEELKKQLEELKKKNPPSRSSYFGIIDLAGFKKDRFYSYQAHWRPDFPMAHIFPHWNWPERLDSITPVHVYTSGDEAELFLNGKSLGRKTKKAGEDFRLVWKDVVYQPGELRVVAYKNGKSWAEDNIRTTGAAVAVKLTAYSDNVKTNSDELCFITATITDANGAMVPRSHPAIHFEVDGPAEIIATDNGDPTSFVPFQSHDREAFNGMALVIVKPKKNAKGIITVKALSNGLATGTVAIQLAR